MTADYQTHYKAFSQNINFAARILHYYLHLGTLAKEGSNEYKALNEHARFWNDFNFVALQTVIIFLGKIFDSQSKTHNLTKLLETLPLSLDHFSKANLRARKIKMSTGDLSWLDEYISRAHELNAEDLVVINDEVQKAEALWKKIKPLRHQYYAHDQMLPDDKRTALFKNVTYGDLELLVQILLNISFVLEQAEINGQQPDFSQDYEGPNNLAEGQIEGLMQLLVTGITPLL